jgi:hypothetical protein
LDVRMNDDSSHDRIRFIGPISDSGLVKVCHSHALIPLQRVSILSVPWREFELASPAG